MKGFKKRFSLLFSVLFVLTLVFGANGMAKAANNATTNTYGGQSTTDYSQRTAIIHIHYRYYNTHGSLDGTGSNVEINYNDLTDANIEAAISKHAPKNAPKFQGEAITGWYVSGYGYFNPTRYDDSNYDRLISDIKHDIESSKGNLYTGVTVEPEYGNKRVVPVCYTYPVASRFAYKEDYSTILVDKSESPESKVDKNYKPANMPAGLNYTWKVTTDEYGIVNLDANTSNYLVNFAIVDTTAKDYEWNEASDTVKSQIVNAGTQITLPTTIDGKAVKWLSYISYNNGEGKKQEYAITDTTYTIQANVSFVGMWDTGKTVELSEKSVAGYTDYVKRTVEYADYTGKKQEAKISMQLATVAPAEILEAAKGHNVDVVLEMAGYSWTINGMDITDAKDINLEVRAKTVVDQKTVNTLAGNRPTKQISLTHNGDLGFKGTLTWNVGKEYQGKYGNLFWYKTDGTFEFISDGKIDEKGNVDLTFTHASDYVIVMNDTPMSAADADAANAAIIAERTSARSPKTGEF